jgi:hypothetical protein
VAAEINIHASGAQSVPRVIVKFLLRILSIEP